MSLSLPDIAGAAHQWNLSKVVELVPLESGYARTAAVVIGVIAFSWILGLIISMTLKALGDRLHKDKTGNVVLTAVGALLRLIILAFGALVAAQAAGLNTQGHIETFGSQALGAIAILVGGWFLASWIAKNIRTMGETVSKRSSKVDRTLFSFIASLVRYLVVAIAIVVALTQFGFQTNSLVAVVGAAGLAIALALQDTLKGAAAGFMLASFRPYRIGDYVEIGSEAGTVVDITPFTTTLKTVTNATVILPNSEAWGNVITNYSADKQRRLDLYFSISYEDDIAEAMEVIKACCTENDLILNDPEPWIGVHALSDWSVDIRCRAWCTQPTFLDAAATMRREVKEAFDANEITIPYPHQVEILRVPKKGAHVSPELRFADDGGDDQSDPNETSEG